MLGLGLLDNGTPGVQVYLEVRSFMASQHVLVWTHLFQASLNSGEMDLLGLEILPWVWVAPVRIPTSLVCSGPTILIHHFSFQGEFNVPRRPPFCPFRSKKDMSGMVIPAYRNFCGTVRCPPAFTGITKCVRRPLSAP